MPPRPFPIQSRVTQSQISTFIVSHIRSLNLAAHETVAGRVLIQACLDTLSGSPRDEFEIEKESLGQLRYKTDRERIVEAIRCMKIGGVLRMFRVGEGGMAGFRLRDGVGGEGGGEREEEEVRRSRFELEEMASGDINERDNNEEEEGEGSEVMVEDDVDDDDDDDVGNEDESWRPHEEEEEEEETQRENAPRAKRTESRRCPEEIGAEAKTFERPHWCEASSLLVDRSSQQESIERADQICQHTEAYNAMIANAAPLIPPPSKQPSMQTPSRKRARPFEIAASDDSSSFEPISPQRYVNSTPRRSAKRMRSGTPLSASRRTSAPGRLFSSPRKCGSLGGLENLKLSQSHGEGSDTFGLGGIDSIRFKEEKERDNSSAEVREIVRDLCDKYPESGFEAENGSIKCLDCDRLLKPTFHGVESHVRGKGHQNNVKQKIAEIGAKKMTCKDIASFLPLPKIMDMGIDFNVVQQPLAVYAQRAAQNLAATREKYLTALENENQAGSIRMSFLESRQDKAEKQNAANLEKFKARIEASEQKVMTISHDVMEKVEGSEEKTRVHLQEIKDRLDLMEAGNDDQLTSMEAQIKKTSEDCDVNLDKVLTIMAKSDHRNIKNIDDLRTNLRNFDAEFVQQISQLESQIRDLDEANPASQREDLEDSIRELETSDLESRIFRAKMETRLNNVENTLRESEQTRLALVAQIKDLENLQDESKAANSEIQSQLQHLEASNVQKEENIHDLGANVQMLTEDLQRQRDGNLHHQIIIKDQIEAHFKFTEKNTRDAEKAAAKREEETCKRERKLEERLVQMFEKRMERIERKNREERAASQRKMQRLRERNKELQGDLDELQAKVLPLIFEDAQDMMRMLGSMEEKVEGLEDFAIKMGMGSRIMDKKGNVRAGSEGAERREITV